MKDKNTISYLEKILKNLPENWLKLTTHRLDIYNEALAKEEFLSEFEKLYQNNTYSKEALAGLPTAYDYIRLGHPLSTVLEWSLAHTNHLSAAQVISFSSNVMPLLAILRKNKFEDRYTRIFYQKDLPENIDFKVLEKVYGYNFELQKINDISEITLFKGTQVYIENSQKIDKILNHKAIDFQINLCENLGSIVFCLKNSDYVAEIQHVRRRESIAMTPANCFIVLQNLVKNTPITPYLKNTSANKSKVLATIQEITKASSKALLGSSGLSIQYAIMMGLIHHAKEQYPKKKIKVIVPPNCYGGTNDQARRVAACLPDVDIMDLPVDGENDMVKSTHTVLTKVAEEDAVPYIIAEIPTNPRVEVPDLEALEKALSKERNTPQGTVAIAPVFILDQTFCPNVNFLGGDQILASVATISYVSGSKFPSGGKCTAGYCVANKKAAHLIPKIEQNLLLCNNQATDLQVSILATQMPTMLQRIKEAYLNTRAFVNFIEKHLPAAKINFVSESLAKQGFTPSVFSLDLPTKGATDKARETYKRAMNLKLIHMMIDQIPDESKYCVSYGQLKGCYWTIPATSTQGTTKEADKDYIARVSVSPNLDLEKHKAVFLEFVNEL